MSSTFMELMSTTKMLKSTITGEPFREGGRISEIKQIQIHKKLHPQNNIKIKLYNND